MKRAAIILLAASLTSCGTRNHDATIDLAGRYVFDPACIEYPKLGVSYFPFIAPDTIPFSIVNVDQDDENTLTIRYQANRGGAPCEEEKRYNLRDKSFRFEDGQLVFISKVDHHDFAVVWGKRTTTIRIQKNESGGLVFANEQRIKSLAIPIFPVFTDVTHTGIVVLVAASTQAAAKQQPEPSADEEVRTSSSRLLETRNGFRAP